jgi:hypothetical protein
VPEGVEGGARLFVPSHGGARGVARHVKQVLGLDVVAVPGLRTPAEFVDCEVLGVEATPQ